MFANYWVAPGTPTFLTKLNQKDFKGYEIFKADKSITSSLNVIGINDIEPLTALFQAGYLTVDRVAGKIYAELTDSFRPPNLETLNFIYPSGAESKKFDV